MSAPVGRVIQAAQHQNVIANARQWGQTRGHIVVRSRGRRNPVALRYSVAVEPEDKPLLNRWVPLGVGGVGSSIEVEHGDQRRQSDENGRLCGSHPAKESSAGKASAPAN